MGWMDLNIEHCLMGGPSDYIARRWIILSLLILGGEESRYYVLPLGGVDMVQSIGIYSTNHQ
jgi:hypothetical protein